ncbi:PREDICTED: protein FAM170A-like isoform X2 [Chinchilla lanigera]|uniref:protein FAM170A-like isoform X2 n=1 Tax=Chinchilla lanigera TaxID=34839 RepID=UPI00038EA352|nr:PREDICTED: protein FAM170A-like isoform X2 [Chinchilla lanigera]
MKHKRKTKHLEPSLVEQPEKRARQDLDSQDDLPGRNNEVAPARDQEETFIDSSNRFSYEDKSIGAGLRQGAEENSTNLEDCSGVSPSGHCSLTKQDGLGSPEMPLDEDMMEREKLRYNLRSPSPCFLDSHSSSSESSEKKRVMKVYYMQVPKKRGADALGDAEDLEPPQKRIRAASVSIPRKLLPKLSLPSLRDTLSDSEDSSPSEVQEQREEAERPSGPRDQEAGGSIQAPDEPVGLEDEFQCMGCHKLFPTVESLKRHVEHAGEEAIECLNFHLALAKLKPKRKTKKIQRRQNIEINKISQGYLATLFCVLVVFLIIFWVVF